MLIWTDVTLDIFWQIRICCTGKNSEDTHIFIMLPYSHLFRSIMINKKKSTKIKFLPPFGLFQRLHYLVCFISDSAASRVTRSQTQQAIEVLEEHIPSMVVDEDRLRYLLALAVQKTKGYNIDMLERVYSQLSYCVFQNRKKYDKTELVQVLNSNILSCYTISFKFN